MEETEAPRGRAAFQFTQLESRSDRGQRSPPHLWLSAPSPSGSWFAPRSAGSITIVLITELKPPTAQQFSHDSPLMKSSPRIWIALMFFAKDFHLPNLRVHFRGLWPMCEGPFTGLMLSCHHLKSNTHLNKGPYSCILLWDLLIVSLCCQCWDMLNMWTCNSVSEETRRQRRGERGSGSASAETSSSWFQTQRSFHWTRSLRKNLKFMKILKQRPLKGKYYYLKILKAKLLHSNLNRSCILLITVFNLMLYQFFLYIWRHRDFITITNILCVHTFACVHACLWLPSLSWLSHIIS